MPTLLHKRGATAALGRTTFQVGEIAINTTLNTVIVGTGNRNSVALAKADASNITPNFSSASTPLTLPGGSVSGGGQLRYRNGEIQSSNASGVFSALSSGTASISTITLTRYANVASLPTSTVARLAWRNDVNRPVISNQSGAYSFLLRDGDTFRSDTCRLADTATNAQNLIGNRVANADSADVALNSSGVAGFKVPVGTTSQRGTTVGDIRLNSQLSKFEGRLSGGYDSFVMESNLSNLIDGVATTGRTNGRVYTIVNGVPAWAAPDTSSSSITASSLTGNFGAIIARSVTTLAGGDITSRNHLYAGHDIETSNGNINARRVSSTASTSAGNGNFDGTVTAARFTINGEYSLPTREAGAAGYVLTAINPTTTEFRAIPAPTAAAGSAAFKLPVGNTIQRGAANLGNIRVNSQTNRPEIVSIQGRYENIVLDGDVVQRASRADTADRARLDTGFDVGSSATRSTAATPGLFHHNSTTDVFEGRGNTGWHPLVSSGDTRLLPAPTLANAGRIAVINATGTGFEYEAKATPPPPGILATDSRLLPAPTLANAGRVAVINATGDGFTYEARTTSSGGILTTDTRLLPAPSPANAGRVPVINTAGTGFNYVSRVTPSPFTADALGNVSSPEARIVRINGPTYTEGLAVFVHNTVETLNRSFNSGGVLPSNQNTPRRGTWQYNGGTTNESLNAIFIDETDRGNNSRETEMRAFVLAVVANKPRGGLSPSDPFHVEITSSNGRFRFQALDVLFSNAGHMSFSRLVNRESWSGRFPNGTITNIRVSNHTGFDTDQVLFTFPQDTPDPEEVFAGGTGNNSSRLELVNRHTAKLITTIPDETSLEALPDGYRMYHTGENREYIKNGSSLFRGPVYTRVTT